MSRSKDAKYWRMVESRQKEIDACTEAMRENVPGSVFAFSLSLLRWNILPFLIGNPEVPNDDILPWDRMVEEGHLVRGSHDDLTGVLQVVLDVGSPDFLSDVASLIDGRECCAEIAEMMYRKAVKSQEPRAANNLALLLSEKGNVDEAKSLFMDADSRGDVLASANLARLYRDSGDHENSLKWFLRAVDLGREDVLAELGLEYVSLGNRELANEALRKAVELGVQDAHSALASYLADEGSIAASEEAEFHYRRAVTTGEYAAEWNFAIFLSAAKRYSDAIPYYEMALRDGISEANLNLAVALERLGLRERAERHYLDAVENGDDPAFADYAAFLLEEDRLSDAIQLGEAAKARGMHVQSKEVGDLIRDYRNHMRGTPPPPV